MNDVDLSTLAVAYAASVGVVALLMGTTMTIALRIGKLSIVDVIWGLGFALVAIVSFASSRETDDTLRKTLVLVMPAVWGVRLATHIGRRNAGQPEDPRYEDLVERSTGGPASVALRKVFGPQALVMLVIAAPIPVTVATEGSLHWWAWVGVLVWGLGLFFETVGDLQLSRFKADPANKGKLMDRGLWHYTRHPNYFGDACVWWGIWLVAAGSWIGVATVFAPAFMTYLLTAKTGKALMEKGLSGSKPGYAEYVERTSGFLPLPPKKPRGERAGSV